MDSLMLQSVYAEQDGAPKPIIVDLGYVDDAETRAHGDALMASGIGRCNFSIEGFGRLLVKIPPRKLAAVLAEFPIDEGETYWRTTHHWRGLKPKDTNNEH